MKNNRTVLLGALVIVLGALAAYHNSLSVPFHFDDIPSILDNVSITHLGTAWSPPQGWGFTVSGRPLLNFSLAVNYALSGTDTWSYHALNLLIHTLAGLTLFGAVRRTLSLPTARSEKLKSAVASPEWLAVLIALIWTVHPLQTESVTYIIQRAESMMGLFYLLTMYAFIRAADSQNPAAWLSVSVVACLLGAGCKEVIVTVPVVVLIYDRAFLSGSFASAWRVRWRYYLALAATWLPLAWLVAGTGGDRGGTFHYTAAAFGAYWLTQFEALARYVQLSIWPAPLVFDYGTAQVSSWTRVALFALPVVGLLAVSLWAFWRKPKFGFLAACFFLILVPTCFVPGVTQVIVEHRMYLPLAVVLAAVVIPLVSYGGRLAFMVTAVVAVGFIALTFQRNAVYRDDFTLWVDTLAKRPLNARAWNNVGSAYLNRGDAVNAVVHFTEAVRLDPQSAQSHFNFGQACERLERLEDALTHYREAVQLLPYFGQANLRIGEILLKLGRPAEAVAPLHDAASRLIYPAEADANLGRALFESGRSEEAVASYRRALTADPKLADAHFNLALALSSLGRLDEAQAAYIEAINQRPAHAQARLNLGIIYAQRGQLNEALVQLTAATNSQPALAEAHANLGIVLTELGRAQDAVSAYEVALKLKPDYAVAHYNLGNALLQQQRWSDAKRHFAEAVRLRPDFDAAQEMLARLREVP